MYPLSAVATAVATTNCAVATAIGVAAAICAVATAVCAIACAIAAVVCAVLSKSDGSIEHKVSVMFLFPSDTCVMYLAYMCQGMRYSGTPSAGPLIGCG
jgi:hypothetical protein